MAQVIAAEQWQEGIKDNSLLPSRVTVNMFTGSGVNIANNTEGPNAAVRVWDMQGTDYITDYDDRRINGLANGGAGFNADGRDGWGASAYGVFQDVRFDSRVYTMGRHRSMALRIFDEAQYTGGIGDWGTETDSNIFTSKIKGTAAVLSEAKSLWEQEVLGVDMDCYNLFAVLNGHISGRWVAVEEKKDGTIINHTDHVMDGDASHGKWVAQPGPVEGQPIQPRFAPIHCIQWEDDNIVQMLQTIKVTWNQLKIPQDNRVIYVDEFYELPLMRALTGNGLPVTEAAYADVQNGSFARLMGWDFNFEIPTNYWPKLYVDANLNVVHSADGQMACDKVINSIAAPDSPDGMLITMMEAARQNHKNFIRTIWDPTEKKFKKIVTNYPMENPVNNPFISVYGNSVNAKTVASDLFTTDVYSTKNAPAAYEAFEKNYPWAGPGAGYGIPDATGPSGTISLKKVIGLALYRPSAQLSQEYSDMVTAQGETRGKFTEMACDVKYDAWVIERLSHGIVPILAPNTYNKTWGIPVIQVTKETETITPNEGTHVSDQETKTTDTTE